MAVPYTFATQTTSIPLAELDTNFSTPITIGTTVIPLGNVAPILENVTLGNVVIASGNVTLTNVNVINATITQATITTANVTTANITSAFITTANIATANVVTIRATTANIATANVTTLIVSAINVATANVTTFITAGITDSGNLAFTGTGTRVTGDFTNATFTNRTAFQTGTANSTTGIYALPAGTSTAASWQATNNSDPTNCSKAILATNGATDVQIVSGINGTGTYLPMSFVTSNTTAMTISIGGTAANVAIGTATTTAGKLTVAGNLAITTGQLVGSYGTGGITTNFAAGDGALQSNTTGSYNSAVGYAALFSNTTGVQNSAMGSQALYYNTASNNTAVGFQAMQGASGTSTGISNSAMGYQALYANTSGTNNAAVGQTALYSNTTGSYNSGMGVVALYSNVSGSNNTAQGVSALFYNTASNNTAVGFQAMYGASGTSTGASNSALGYQALYVNTTGGSNTAVGYQALFTNSTGSSNTGIGNSAGYSTTGNYNTLIGLYRGALTPVMTTGSNWTVLSDGQANVKLAIDTNSAIWAVNGQPFFNSPTPAAKTVAGTLTVDQLLAGIITYNGLAATLTMPLGSDLDTAITATNLPINFAFEFVVINLGATTATMAANTGVTFVGTLTVLTLTSVRWRVRKTAASTFIVYRVSN